jgi:hypothetical protein
MIEKMTTMTKMKQKPKRELLAEGPSLAALMCPSF